MEKSLIRIALGACAALSPLAFAAPVHAGETAGTACVSNVPAEGWRLAATLRHVGAQYEDDLQADVLPAAIMVDAFLEVPLGHGASLVLRGENVFDEAVVTRNSGGSIDLGVPRTLWAGCAGAVTAGPL